MAGKIVEKRRFVWTIADITRENVSELEETKEVDSEEFKIGLGEENTTEWHFNIDVQSNGNCGFYIVNDEIDHDHGDVSLLLKVATRSPDNKIHYLNSRATDANDINKNGEGWPKLLNVNDHLDETNDKLTFFIDLKLFLNVPPMTKQPKEFIDLVGLFNSEKFSDIAIVCSDGKTLTAHRCVLYGRSSVFKAMLDAEMSEKKSARVDVSDIDCETMLEVLRFMYTNKIQNVEALATKIIYAAEKYDLQELKAMCASEMITQITSENVLQFLMLADLYNEKMLFQECMEVIRTDFQKVNKSESCQNVSADLMFKCMQYLEDSAAALIPLSNTFADE